MDELRGTGSGSRVGRRASWGERPVAAAWLARRAVSWGWPFSIGGALVRDQKSRADGGEVMEDRGEDDGVTV
jgi:hypothetical protein